MIADQLPVLGLRLSSRLAKSRGPRNPRGDSPLCGRGVSLIEMLCVMAIITILASLLVPTVMRAYSRVRGMTQEWEAPDIAAMLETEIRGYCAVNTNSQFATKTELADKCGLAPKCKDWVNAPTTDFVPFTFLDDTNKLVLAVHLGRNHATLYAFTKGDLTVTPPPR